MIKICLMKSAEIWNKLPKRNWFFLNYTQPIYIIPPIEINFNSNNIKQITNQNFLSILYSVQFLVKNRSEIKDNEQHREKKENTIKMKRKKERKWKTLMAGCVSITLTTSYHREYYIQKYRNTFKNIGIHIKLKKETHVKLIIDDWLIYQETPKMSLINNADDVRSSIKNIIDIVFISCMFSWQF